MTRARFCGGPPTGVTRSYRCIKTVSDLTFSTLLSEGWLMKQIKTRSFLWAVFAGFLGAGLFVWLFHGIPVIAQDDRMVVKAHKFVVLNDNNEPVGVLASTTGPGGPGLPYLSLEGMHGEGKIFIGIFKPGNPQVRLQGENGR